MVTRDAATPTQAAIAKDLEGVSREVYGAEYNEHRLEQYKLFVQSAEKISDRRLAANAFFVSVNAALLTLFGVLGPRKNSWAINISGFVVSLVWYFLLRSYQGLNAGKFRVIHEMEQTLPMRMYEAEWTSLGKGEIRQIYLSFTTIEGVVAGIFAILFVLLLVVA